VDWQPPLGKSIPHKEGTPLDKLAFLAVERCVTNIITFHRLSISLHFVKQRVQIHPELADISTDTPTNFSEARMAKNLIQLAANKKCDYQSHAGDAWNIGECLELYGLLCWGLCSGDGFKHIVEEWFKIKKAAEWLLGDIILAELEQEKQKQQQQQQLDDENNVARGNNTADSNNQVDEVNAVTAVEQEQRNTNALAHSLAHHSNKSDISRKRITSPCVEPAKRQRKAKALATNRSIA
jgi:hypothetical protein